MSYDRLTRSTATPGTVPPQESRPNKRELYHKIWTRYTHVPKSATTILDEVIATCREQGADYNDVLTTAMAAKNEDAARDATSRG
jgi:hypothetical protein